jgi:hypothetical protein
MPPFITHNGQTGYFQNGVFVPATQEQYNNQMSMYNQFGNNPFVSAQQTFTQQQQSVQQGVIKPPTAGPLSNEQKVSIAQGDATSTNQYNPQDKLNYEFTDKGLGFKAGNQFYPSTAMTTGGMPLIGSPYKGRTLNAYDLAKEDSSKYGNPYLAIQNQLMNNTPPWMSNTTTPNQAQVTVPQTTGATEIVPTSTAEQAGGGNWLTNMFNKPSVEGVPVAENVADNGLKSDVLGDWGKMGFNGKEFFKSDKGQATSAIAGAGVGLVSGLAKAGMQDKYDPRVGMSKPNLGGNLFGDATFTQVGLNPALMAATGGISALVGGGVDLIKNAVKYAKQKDRYENKKLATDTMQSIDDARENMKPDYTGYARSGTQVNPYLKAQYGTAIVDGKKMDIDSDEYRRLYNSGNLMRVDEEGMPTMTTEEVVVMDQMTDNTRKQREIQKERDAQGLNYNWSSGSNNPYISQPQSTVPTGINITQPSLPPIEDVLYNTEDDLLNDYRGKSFGSNPFPYNSSDGLAMGYNPNNAWMSTGVGSVDDGTSILGHLAVRYGDDYNDNLKNNDIPTLYFFEKDLSKEKGYLNDVGGDAGKYYDSRKELLEMADIHERESRYINNVLLPQGYTYNTVLDEPGNKLIRSLTPDKDKFMGSVTLTPEMYQQIASSKSPEEAKRKLVKMAKISPDINMDHLFIHMNLSRPKKLSPYLRAKSINPESVIGWHDERPGNKYDKNGNLIKPTVKTYKQGGKINPYLKAQYGTEVIVDGKKINTDSKEYRDMYASGNLMNVDKDGIPIRWSGEEAVVTAQMTDTPSYNWGTGYAPKQTVLKTDNNAYSVGTTMPSKSWAQVRPENINFNLETDEGKKNEAVFRAKETMKAIKDSEGYKQTLENVINESEYILDDDQKNISSDYMFVPGSKKYPHIGIVDNDYLKEKEQSLYDYQFNNPYGLFYDLEKQRNQNVDYKKVGVLSQKEADEQGVLGYMMSHQINNTYDKKRNPEYHFIKDIMMVNDHNMDENIATAVEEIEHYQQFRPYKDEMKPYRSPYINNPGKMHNMTPFESKTIREYNTSHWDYLQLPYETAAKKRASEVYFINEGMLQPGEKMNQKHYDYLEKEYNKWLNGEKTFVPNNVLQYYDLSEPSFNQGWDIFDEYRKEAKDEGVDIESYNKALLDEKNQSKAIQNARKKRANNFIMLSKLLAQNNKNFYDDKSIS